MCNLRIGQGFDIHQMCENRKLILGGIEIPYEKGLLGHSDADCLLHSIIDAILGAIADGDIGSHFPDTDEKYKNANSVDLLKQALKIMKNNGYKIVNIDSTIKAQAPKMRPYIDQIRNNLSDILELPIDDISVKAKTMEYLDSVGEKKSIICDAIVLLEKK